MRVRRARISQEKEDELRCFLEAILSTGGHNLNIEQDATVAIVKHITRWIKRTCWQPTLTATSQYAIKYFERLRRRHLQVMDFIRPYLNLKDAIWDASKRLLNKHFSVMVFRHFRWLMRSRKNRRKLVMNFATLEAVKWTREELFYKNELGDPNISKYSGWDERTRTPTWEDLDDDNLNIRSKIINLSIFLINDQQYLFGYVRSFLLPKLYKMVRIKIDEFVSVCLRHLQLYASQWVFYLYMIRFLYIVVQLVLIFLTTDSKEKYRNLQN